MTIRRSLALTLFVLVTSSGTARASDHRHDRSGFYVGVGAGAGSGRVQLVDATTSGRRGGTTLDVRLGGGLNDGWLLGLEATAYLRREDGNTTFLGSAILAATYFPAGRGSFVSVGAGIAGVQFKPADIGWGRGFGLHAAIGHEWRLTPRFAFAPKAEFNQMFLRDPLDFANFFTLKLQGTWY
jgi:hypothetical protein